MTEPSVEVIDVHKRLGHNRVLRGVSVSLSAGGVVALVGANGSGKSTLLRILSGQLRPDVGSVWLCGNSMAGVGQQARSHMGYAPDNNEAFLELTGTEFLHLVYGLRRVTPGALEAEHSSQLELDSFGQRRMRALSFGQRKRVCLAAALGGDPDVLLLDEPTNGIDVGASEYLAAVVHARKERGKITIATTHDARVLDAWRPELLKLADGVVSR